MVGTGLAGGMAADSPARGRRGGDLARRTLRIRALTAALALTTGLAVPVVRAHLRARAADLRQAAVIDAVGAARVVAGAMETYDIERGSLPPAAGGVALASALGPYLPWPVLADDTSHPFSYAVTPGGYRLRFTPAAGDLTVVLRVTLGVGGTAIVGASRVRIGW